MPTFLKALNNLLIYFRCSNTMNEMPALTQQRHRDNLTNCVVCLKNYLIKTQQDENTKDYALIAEELRQVISRVSRNKL